MKTTTAHPHCPKILPWLAHKAGISEPRAEVLWHSAQCHAAQAAGETGTSAYWAAALDRLLELITAESVREDAASFGWRPWTRMNERFWQAPLVILEALTQNSVRCWRSLKPLQFG